MKAPRRNRRRWAAAVLWVVITTPLAYHLNARELLPAAQYEVARERIASLHWSERLPVTGHTLAPETYLLERVQERERYDGRRLLGLHLAAATMAIMTGASLPFLLLVFLYRKRTGPTRSL